MGRPRSLPTSAGREVVDPEASFLVCLRITILVVANRLKLCYNALTLEVSMERYLDGLVTVEVLVRAVIRIPRNINARLKRGDEATFKLWETDLGNRLGGTAVVDDVTEEITSADGNWRNTVHG